MKNSFTNNLSKISQGVIIFNMILIGVFTTLIYHSLNYPKTDAIVQISTITTLPDLSLSVGTYEKRLRSYNNNPTLYPDIEPIDYLGFVYDK